MQSTGHSVLDQIPQGQAQFRAQVANQPICSASQGGRQCFAHARLEQRVQAILHVCKDSLGKLLFIEHGVRQGRLGATVKDCGGGRMLQRVLLWFGLRRLAGQFNKRHRQW